MPLLRWSTAASSGGSKGVHGTFPELHVMNYIKGDDVVAAHGSRDMPIWGQIFGSMSPNQDLVQVRVYNLLKYIEGVQAK
jgi:hypothetical protein